MVPPSFTLHNTQLTLNLHAIAADEQLNNCPILVFLQYEISILQALSAMHNAMNLCVQTLQDAYMFSDNDNDNHPCLQCEQLHGGPAKTILGFRFSNHLLKQCRAKTKKLKLDFRKVKD